jgi:glycine oxidase
MVDLLVVGGGVIGLSIAYEAAKRGRGVRVIDAAQPAREASWAGAGILPPAGEGDHDQLEQLVALSNRLHAAWTEDLRAETGIDNGYRRCGAIYLAREACDVGPLDELAHWAASRNIVAEPLLAGMLQEVEPALRPSGKVAAAYLMPEERQIRNPRHLKALLLACAQRGVEISAGLAAEDFEIRGRRVRAVRTIEGPIAAGQVCLTTGSWTAAVARRLGVQLAIKPMRGQIALLSLHQPILSRIVNEGSRYLVPRSDGRLLVGSTQEDAGFDRSNTAGAIGELLRFAQSLVPDLATAQLERTWAGLRPATRDGLPYLGAVPELDNAWIAAGHFRGGLQLSTGTAIVMNQLLAGERPEVDLAAFRLDRAATAEHARQEVSLPT